MTNPTPKRFRLRFSIRTLVVLVTLVGCYYFFHSRLRDWSRLLSQKVGPFAGARSRWLMF